jgi:Cu+-exporting ATPase
MEEYRTVSFQIIGMDCASCGLAIENRLKPLKGIADVILNFPGEKATVSYNPKLVSLEDILRSVNETGYDVRTENVAFTVASKTESKEKLQEIEKIEGIVNIKLYKEKDESHLSIEYLPEVTDEYKLKKQMSQFFKIKEHLSAEPEHTAEEHDDRHTEVPKEKEINKLRLKAIISLILGVMVFAGSFTEIFPYKNIVLFILTTPVIFWGGSQFFFNTWKALRRKRADMDSLIAIGSGTAYIYSTFITFTPQLLDSALPANVYFETSSLIIGFILLGKYFEARSKGHTNDAIKKLLNLQPQKALVIRNEKEMEIPVSELEVGDIIRINAGDRIPTDGVIIEGRGFIDESAITGESLPKNKASNDEVIGSTINKDGSFLMQAVKVGKETLISQIINATEKALSNKAAAQKLADKVASVFVPAVIILSVAVFCYWHFIAENTPVAVITFISVLIISCPCALGLATPTAILVGTGRGARLGILLKGGSALEEAKKIDTLIFDKTGTLTYGNFEVLNVIPKEGLNEKRFLIWAASLEKHSSHPIAKTIVNFAKIKNLILEPIHDFQNIEGKGVIGKVGQQEIIIGNLRLMEETGSKFSKDLVSKAEVIAKNGKTPVFVSRDREMVGVLGIGDDIRDEAPEAVQSLKKLGLEIYIITGDNRNAAQNIASNLKIRNIIAEVLPQGKSNEIKKLKQEKKRIAFVGDGTNDAPALAESNLGIAIGTGTDIAIEASDITLIGDDLRKIETAINLSRQTVTVIKQNMFWAFFYNICAIPIAAGIFFPITGLLLNPAIAGLAMAFSSVLVVSNSLRLNKVPLQNKGISEDMTLKSSSAT